ncbi:DegT/DnrJ/EryC1/StrS aminotransferase family protein [bacterium 1XD42-8]|nr:DegT/DnrJ/EryC1/StrS aminotransferase family protein [bacterium 1XD42-8]
MEFRSLKEQYKEWKEEIDRGIQEVISNANFIMGRQVLELEEKLEKFIGVENCITCANGTDALSLALMAWEIGPGDAVFVPDFTFFSSGEVITFEGATPVFVDVREDTYNIDVLKLEEEIKRVIQEGKLRPKVIIPVDLFGQPAEYEKIRQLAKKYGLKILEDGAQGFGGGIGHQKACSFGDISTTSFFPVKPLGCYGDGGAIFTNDSKTAELLRSLRVHGKGDSKYDNVRVGMNSRLDTIQAAILLVKLKAFQELELEKMNHVTSQYTVRLKDVVKTPVILKGYHSSWAQYTIQLCNQEQRDGLQAYLKEKGIPTMIYYPKPMHEQGAFSTYYGMDERLKVTKKLCKTVLSLPIHPYMKEEEIDIVSEEIKKYLGEI